MEFKWTVEREKAFSALKKALASDLVLVHYNDRLPRAIATDSSQYGVGAVLYHIVDGKERPIAYTFRTLSDAKKRFGQIERESAGIIFGVKRFEKFCTISHSSFTLITDRLLSFSTRRQRCRKLRFSVYNVNRCICQIFNMK